MAVLRDLESASAYPTAAEVSQLWRRVRPTAVQQVAAQGDMNDADLIPIARVPVPEGVKLSTHDELVYLVATGADLNAVLRMIAEHHGLNLALAPDVGGPLTVSIRGARLDEVLDAILGVAGFSWHRVDNMLYVTGGRIPGMDPRVQGRYLQVYPLNYISANDVEDVANSLLSPVGNAFVSQSDPIDQMRTRETLVIEDTPAAHARIAQYIAQIDVPPKQVLIEAHIMQISLTDAERHGINLKTLVRAGNSQIELEGSGFADDAESGPSVALRLKGSDMTGLLELIRECTNSRTLASPKLSVINQQEAKIQIGQRLPYAVATTVQTTTVQSVEFLDVGVVLTVRPTITDDGNVVMSVLPKVSGGKILASGFPEEETTEVQTTIMIPDGGGVVIGGLIREDNVLDQAMVPWLGNIPVVGHLFRRKSQESRRSELIVALVAHVIHNGYGPRQHEETELHLALPDYAERELINRGAYGYEPSMVTE
ncbi:type II secretion system protein GspD [Rubripirellula lacrimiformis]|uniref:type II secretion system protein GspD n=1 Tax=Rubripirellula lacrimiformis TaxID=1930273 RepID=UPI001C54C390|nr:secretin N-terminal domain-containing protein [Rubripirellula lacrimiformis]